MRDFLAFVYHYLRLYVFCLICGSFYLPTALPSNATSNKDTTFILIDSALTEKLERGVAAMYNWEFDSANMIYDLLTEKFPHHPATPFFKSQLTYWKNAPLDYRSPVFTKIVDYLKQSISYSDRILKEYSEHREAVFFKMMSHALLSLFYNDMGETLKAARQARWILKYLSIAKKEKEKLNDFYLGVGIYNYFREAFPERYPIYKPIAIFFTAGDKEKGLFQLHYTANHSLFSAAEALNFLTQIYLEYEYEKEKATEAAYELVRRYPQNRYFYIKYIEVLILIKNFEKAQYHIDQMQKYADEPFYQMSCLTLQAMLYDLRDKDAYQARKTYLEARQMIAATGEVELQFRAYIYDGLSRYASKERERKYYKQLGHKNDKEGMLKVLKKY